MDLDVPELRTERLLVRRLTMADLEFSRRLDMEAAGGDVDWTVRSYDALLALGQPPYGERAIALADHSNTVSIGVVRAVGMAIEENPFPEPPWFQIIGILGPQGRETSDG
jgi:hypothetical protein